MVVKRHPSKCHPSCTTHILYSHEKRKKFLYRLWYIESTCFSLSLSKWIDFGFRSFPGPIFQSIKANELRHRRSHKRSEHHTTARLPVQISLIPSSRLFGDDFITIDCPAVIKYDIHHWMIIGSPSTYLAHFLFIQYKFYFLIHRTLSDL